MFEIMSEMIRVLWRAFRGLVAAHARYPPRGRAYLCYSFLGVCSFWTALVIYWAWTYCAPTCSNSSGIGEGIMYLVFLPLGIPIGFAFLLAVVNTLHASLDWRLILLLIMTIALGFYAANFDIDWISGMGPAI